MNFIEVAPKFLGKLRVVVRVQERPVEPTLLKRFLTQYAKFYPMKYAMLALGWGYFLYANVTGTLIFNYTSTLHREDNPSTFRFALGAYAFMLLVAMALVFDWMPF